jgi:hypothetical protein
MRLRLVITRRNTKQAIETGLFATGVTVLIGSNDDMIKGLYVDPLKKLRDDWTIVEIKDGNHLSCIMKPQFRDEIAAWLKKNGK